MNRFQGYISGDKLFVLDAFTGAVKLVSEMGTQDVCEAWATDVVPITQTLPTSSVNEQKQERVPQSMDSLDMMVLSSFPYPIATTYKSFLHEPDPRLRCKLLVDTFTNIIKMWALQIASEYLISPDIKDTSVNQTLSRDFQRPLISAWNLMLHRCIPVLQEAKIDFFSPELPRCYEQLESRCKDKFSIKKRYEDKEGNSKFKISKLGKIQALIKYRNSLAHGYNQSPQQAEKELTTYVPLLREILESSKFMTRTPLCMLKKNGQKYEVIQLMGLSHSSNSMEIPDLEIDPDSSPVFLYDPTRQRVLPLFSFFDIEETEGDGMGFNQDVFLFEGRTKKSVIYLSTQGEHLEKQSKYHYWVELLSKKSLEVKLITPDKMGLDILRAACERINNRTLAKLVKSGQFIPKVSHFRSDFHVNMQQFIAGNFRVFLLTGDNGVGKTTYLAQMIDHSEHITLFYSASEFQNTDLGSKILRDIGFRGMFLEDFLANSNEHFLEAKRKFLLVIDALNDYKGSLSEMMTTINQLTEQVEDYPWFRIIISIRTAPYERCSIKLQSRFSQGLFTVEDPIKLGVQTHEIRMLDIPSNLIPDVYESYRNYQYVDPEDEEDLGVYIYRPRTAFTDIDQKGSTVELIRHPLMLRLVMSSFHRRVLPSNLTDDEIMPIFIEKIIVEAQSVGGGYPNRKRFLVALARYLFSCQNESAKLDDLYDVPLLEKELKNRQADSAYVQLIDMGILQEFWQDDDAYVCFSMDELLSYLLVQIVEPQINTPTDVITWSNKTQLFPPITNTLRMILHRAIRDGRQDLFLDVLDLIEISEEQADNDSVIIMQQCEQVLYSLCINNDHGLNELLTQMEVNPSWGDFLLLKSLIERCLVNGTVAHLEKLLRTIDAEGIALGVDANLISTSVQMQTFQETGQSNKAVQLFEERRTLGSGRLDAKWAKVLYLALRVYKDIGDIESAKTIYEELVDFESLSMELRVNLLWVMGLILFEQDQPTESEKLLLEGLELARSKNLNEPQLNLLNALARVQIAANKIMEGLNSLEKVIHMASELGNKSAELLAENSLAVTRRSIGEVELAVQGLFRSLNIAEQLGRKVSAAVAHTNIGVLLWMSEDERALSHQQRAHQIFTDANFPRGVGYCLYRMLIMSPSNTELVEQFSNDLTTLSEVLSYSKMPIWIAGAKLMKLLIEGDLDEIQKCFIELKDVRSHVSLSNIHVEDGPIFPWMYAAQKMEEVDRIDDIKTIVNLIDTELNNRYFHMRDELERLRELTL